VAPWRRGPRRAQAQAVEDGPHDLRLVDRRQDSHFPASFTLECVHGEHAPQYALRTWRVFRARRLTDVKTVCTKMRSTSLQSFWSKARR
jgi:hypothetical protein